MVLLKQLLYEEYVQATIQCQVILSLEVGQYHLLQLCEPLLSKTERNTAQDLAITIFRWGCVHSTDYAAMIYMNQVSLGHSIITNKFLTIEKGCFTYFVKDLLGHYQPMRT